MYAGKRVFAQVMEYAPWQLFDAPLTDLQRQVLALLNIPTSAFRALA